jgi:hypothetical protein
MTPKQKRVLEVIKHQKTQKRKGDMYNYVLLVILGAGLIKLILWGLEKL